LISRDLHARRGAHLARKARGNDLPARPASFSRKELLAAERRGGRAGWIVYTPEVKQQVVNLGVNPIGRGSLDELQASTLMAPNFSRTGEFTWARSKAKFNEEMAKAVVMLDGNGLQPSSKGARVRFSATTAP
jgi:hypothetical protein